MRLDAGVVVAAIMMTVIGEAAPVAGRAPSAVEQYDIGVAEIAVDGYRRMLADRGRTVPAAVVIVVEPHDAMPRPEIEAHTTRVGSICVMHFNPTAVRQPLTIAHETCHCVHDWRVLGERGFVGISRYQAAKREEEARACAFELVNRGGR